MTPQFNRPLRVFLSHASEDKSAIRKLRSLLRENNIDVWLDEERILPGQSWEHEIRKGLDEADVVIVCLSKRLINKEGYIQRELRMALRKAEEKPEDTIYLIPLKLEDCETPSSFEHIQWANMFFQNGEFDRSILERVMLSLRKRAESLGIQWASFFKSSESATEETPSPDRSDRSASKSPPRTIELDTKREKASSNNTHKVFKRQADAIPIVAVKSQIPVVPPVLQNVSLVVYLVDVSATMGKPLRGKTRLDFVHHALEGALQEMAFRSRNEDDRITPRYKVAIYTYSDDVEDILNGAQTIDILAKNGLPRFRFKNRTDTARAFSSVEKLLQQELHNLQDSTPPLVCHITDGKFTGENPISVAQRIFEMSVKQGNILIENLYICDDWLAKPINNIKDWAGVTDKSDLSNEYAPTLFDMSSKIPITYYNVLKQNGYKIAETARLLFPGEYANELTRHVLP